jgi:hypothetical protein
MTIRIVSKSADVQKKASRDSSISFFWREQTCYTPDESWSNISRMLNSCTTDLKVKKGLSDDFPGFLTVLKKWHHG